MMCPLVSEKEGNTNAEYKILVHYQSGIILAPQGACPGKQAIGHEIYSYGRLAPARGSNERGAAIALTEPGGSQYV
jgi:hypothetical protein